MIRLCWTRKSTAHLRCASQSLSESAASTPPLIHACRRHRCVEPSTDRSTDHSLRGLPLYCALARAGRLHAGRGSTTSQ